MISVCNLALSLTQGPVSNFWRRLTDTTFKGLYQVNSFDLAIMLPYFLCW